MITMLILQIKTPKVCELRYKGVGEPNLKKDYVYPCIVSEFITTKGSQLRITFLSGTLEALIYEDFYVFANDWIIVKSIKFNEPYNK